MFGDCYSIFFLFNKEFNVSIYKALETFSGVIDVTVGCFSVGINGCSRYISISLNWRKIT